MKFRFSLIIALLAVPLFGMAAETSNIYPANGANYRLFTNEQPPLLPKPKEVEWQGHSQAVTTVSINYPSPQSTGYPAQMDFIISELSQFLKTHEISVDKNAPFRIDFRIVDKLPGNLEDKINDPAIASEAYELIAVDKGVFISATSTKGLYYGYQTLRQLILRRDNKTTIALCKINDWPDFQIRGFTNDVGRNYMPMELITQELDSLAGLKMNVYHFHCTENEGWRLESKIYPQLNDPKHFTRMPGKFYTQQEFKQLVEYCRLRNILVIPEMDMPGHSACFRRALRIEEMKDPRATEALVKLVKELCSLIPADRMPYIHIGTDEAHSAAEQVTDDILKTYFDTVEQCGRKPIRWQPGLTPRGYNGAVQHLWSGRQARRAWPSDGAEYIDSLETYLNHLDPFEVAMTMYFRRPCPFTDGKALGMFLCSWPDLPIDDPRNQVLQTPVYAGMAFVSEPLWNNPHPKIEGDPNDDEYMKYFSNLPPQGDSLLEGFAEYENRVLAIRDRFFRNREFNYVRQSHIPWRLIGPFPHECKTDTVFPPEEIAKTGKPAERYTHNGTEYTWQRNLYTGATIIFKHYCDFPTLFNGAKMGTFPDKNKTWYAMTYIYSPKAQDVPFWISGHTWATSDWRNGPVSVPGKWFHADPKFWVNGHEIKPPKWEKPNNNGPMVDENYHFRKPTIIRLKQGWNLVLVKSPNNNATRRWMFTFVPVLVDPKNPGCNVREFPGLKFSATPVQ